MAVIAGLEVVPVNPSAGVVILLLKIGKSAKSYSESKESKISVTQSYTNVNLVSPIFFF